MIKLKLTVLTICFALSGLLAKAQTAQITCFVYDADGKAAAAALAAIPKLKNDAITDSGGKYQLTGVSAGNCQLNVRGFNTGSLMQKVRIASVSTGRIIISWQTVHRKQYMSLRKH